jgi:hypothetical protein
MLPQGIATFGGLPGFCGMKTFLKILLVLVVAVIAVKLLPLTLALGAAIGVALVIAVALGFGAIAVLLCAAIVLVAVLSPIWIPVLALLGVIALIKRGSRSGSNSSPGAAA